MIDRASHRRAMAELADTYFAAQCERLGPVGDVPAPSRPRREMPAPARKRQPRAPAIDRFKL